jgi:hypothetical protein
MDTDLVKCTSYIANEANHLTAAVDLLPSLTHKDKFKRRFIIGNFDEIS